MRMQQKLTDVVFDNIEKHTDRMISGEITISNQNSNKEEQTQGHNNEVKPCSQTEPDSDCCSLKKGTLVAVLGFSGIYPLPLCFSLGTILVVLEGMEESQFYGKKPLITLSEPYQTAPKKIQCIELEGAKRSVIIIK
jgi:hypothetical protein